MFLYEYEFSIVMGYYNRKKQLLNTLLYFEKKYKHHNYEVIIVDDNSSPEHKLSDIKNNYTFPLKIIEISKDEKGDRINPCVVYNKGFKEAKGKIVIIQNPECIHVGDVLSVAKREVNDNNYIAFSCFAPNTQEKTNAVMNNLSLMNNKRFVDSHSIPWYNHPKYRPQHYHFCAGITNDNLKILGGFNEDFAKGHSYDDNEILLSIEKNLKLQIKSLPPSCGGMVIHQWHARDCEKHLNTHSLLKLLNYNKNLYNKLKKNHNNYNFNFPKLLHLYWDGSSLSYLNLMTIYSFNKYNTGWKINVYCPKKRILNKSWRTNEQKLEYTGKDYFNELYNISNVNIHTIDFDLLDFKFKNASEVIKSDYFRLYILYKYGGVWSDFDIIYTKSLSKFYHNNLINLKDAIFYYFLQNTTKYFPVGFLIMKKNNIILKKILNNINNYYNPNNYQCLGTTMLIYIFSNYNKFFGIENINKIRVQNADVYLKIKWNELHKMFKENDFERYDNDSNIFGIHWYNGSREAKVYCNNLNIKELKNNGPKCLIDNYVLQYV